MNPTRPQSLAQKEAEARKDSVLPKVAQPSRKVSFINGLLTT